MFSLWFALVLKEVACQRCAGDHLNMLGNFGTLKLAELPGVWIEVTPTCSAPPHALLDPAATLPSPVTVCPLIVCGSEILLSGCICTDRLCTKIYDFYLLEIYKSS